MKSESVKVGSDVVLQSLTGSSGEWLGLGGIGIQGEQMRSSKRPITVRIDSPDGYSYPTLKLQGLKKLAGGGIQFGLSAVGWHMERGEYFDDYGQSVLWIRPFEENVEDELIMEINPVSMGLGERRWTGFS